jgi:hypothetical protein
MRHGVFCQCYPVPLRSVVRRRVKHPICCLDQIKRPMDRGPLNQSIEASRLEPNMMLSCLPQGSPRLHFGDHNSRAPTLKIHKYISDRNETHASCPEFPCIFSGCHCEPCRNIHHSAGRFPKASVKKQRLSLYLASPKRQKHTTGGIPRWSPTLVLVARFSAYVWQSGRDAQFSLTYGRMCLS